MALPREFRLREGVVLESDATGVRWEILVAGARYCQLYSTTPNPVSMRLPTGRVREIFSLLKAEA